jgi:hypothetical protein
MIRDWVSAVSTAIVAASALALIFVRPSIHYDRHEISLSLDHSVSQLGSTPVEAMSQRQVQAWVEAAMRERMAQEPVSLDSSARPSGNFSNEDESKRLAQLAIQMEVLKETQATLWRQVQQHGLYLQSAWLGSPEQTNLNGKTSINRQ